MNEPLSCAVADRVRPFFIAPRLHRVDVCAVNVEVHSSYSRRVIQVLAARCTTHLPIDCSRPEAACDGDALASKLDAHTFQKCRQLSGGVYLVLSGKAPSGLP
jgi:hypothetical protein